MPGVREEGPWLGEASIPAIDLGLSGAIVPTSLWQRRSTWIVVASSLFGAVSPGHPTALLAADVVLRVAFASVFVLAAMRASRTVVLVSSAVVALAVVAGGLGSFGDLVVLVFAVGGLGCGLVSLRQSSRMRWLLASAGALSSQAALRIPTQLPTRVPSAVAAGALALVIVSGWPNQSRRNRRRYRRAGLGVAALAVLASAGGAVSVALARGDAERGVANARNGLTAARGGDTSAASPAFRAAEADLRGARADFSRWFAVPARAVPIVGQHLDVLRRLTGTAADVVATATETLDGAQLQSFRAEGGRIDVQRMRALGRRMTTADDALTRARSAVAAARGPWLVPFVAHRTRSFDADLTDAQHTTSQARQVLNAVPELLGIDGPRRYLLVVGNPAEARGSGGVIGNFGELTADNGMLRLERFGRTTELNSGGLPGDDRRITGPADYVARYAPDGVAPVWSNVNLTPDFSAAANVMSQLYPQSGGRPVDGVISADPVALAGLLRLTGPVVVPGWPDPITSENAAKLLMFDLYASFESVPGGRAARINVLGEVSQAVWQALSSASLPAPATMTAALKDAVAGRHLQLWSSRPAEQAYLERIGVTGSVPSGGGDLFGLVVNNGGANKIDWFLDRSTTYDVLYDPATKKAKATATIVLRNSAPATGFGEELIGNQIGEPIGSMTMLVSVYSAGTLTSATIDGRPFNESRNRELGAELHAGWLYLPSATTTTLRFTYDVALPAGGYRLRLLRQPDAQDRATVDVHVAVKGAWQPESIVGLSAAKGTYSASVPATGTRVLALG